MSLKTSITDIITRLQDEVTALKFVKIFNNQFDYMEQQQTYSFPMPCAFIEVVPQQFAQLGGGYQQSDVDFRIHIGQDQYDAGDGDMEQNTTIFDLRDLVYAALAGYKPTMCGELFKISEEQDYQHSNIYHYIIDFRTGFIDKSASALIEPTTVENMSLDLDTYFIHPDDFNDDFNDDFGGYNIDRNIDIHEIIIPNGTLN